LLETFRHHAGMNGASVTELIRRLEQLVRYGTIAELDLGQARCRVSSGELLSNWVPWITLRAGTTLTWNPPTVGEQCLLLAPGGRPEAAVALLGIYSDANAAPSSSAALHAVHYPDGTLVTYDHQAHELTATLASGGRATINADHCAVNAQDVTVHAEQIAVNAPTTTWTGNIAMTGNIQLTGGLAATGSMAAAGNVSAGGDVTAGDISLQRHVHGKVRSGSDVSGIAE